MMPSSSPSVQRSIPPPPPSSKISTSSQSSIFYWSTLFSSPPFRLVLDWITILREKSFPDRHHWGWSWTGNCLCSGISTPIYSFFLFEFSPQSQHFFLFHPRSPPLRLVLVWVFFGTSFCFIFCISTTIQVRPGPKFLTKFIFNFKPSDLKYFHSFIQIATIEVGPGFGVVFCGLLGFWFSYAHQASHFPSRSSLSATTPSRRPIFDPDLVSLQLRLPGVLFSIQI